VSAAGQQDLEVWFLTGSQDLYGEETLRQVAEQSAEVVRLLAGSEHVPVRVVAKPVLKEADAIRRTCLDARSDDACIGVIAWMHTFSPAKMWISGLEALGKPFLHLHTQAGSSLPWSSIDMDFMNLNQAAHGDREFASVQTRMRMDRKVVFGHASDPAVGVKVGAWARAAVGWHTVQHLKVARFGDNMRNVAVTEGDKVEAEIRLGVSVNTWGVNDLVAVVDAVEDRRIAELVAEYEDAYDVVPSCAPAATGTTRCGRRPGSRPACARSSPTAASAPSPRTSRTSAACGSCPASPCSG
jgi:L-arabinose isomerase